ncbi:division/cell wall cluster transcriptional repressor MraZ [Saprospiraceae bacterium]|nr:division/cell wall cluster transcriptional repressor MraZ [Saprospiraceae bacterium]
MGAGGFSISTPFLGINVVFTGTYQRSLDSKSRFLIPKRMRSELTDATTIFLTPGTDHCLELHTGESLNELAQRASHSAAGTRNVKSFARLFYAQAEPCEIDSQGRIRIPKALRMYAKFVNEIVIVGVGFNWEIWDPQLWQSYLADHEDEFDKIAQATFDQINTNLAAVEGELATSTHVSPSGEVETHKPNPR